MIAWIKSKPWLYKALMKCHDFYMKIHEMLMRAAWHLFVLFPLNNKKVVFGNFYGGGFGDNPKFIAEELLKRDLGFEMYWMLEDKKSPLPEGIRPVRPNTFAFAYHMATAKFWVDNTRKQHYLIKRKEQYYIQTWHGGPGLKKVELDVAHSISKEYQDYAKADSKRIDLFLSCCKWCSDLYHRAFWYDGPLLEKGIPKNDLYFQDPAPIRKKVRERFSIPEDAKLIMYAPTYRDDRSTDMYNLDYDRTLHALKTRFGGTWYLFVRLHPNCAALAGAVTTSEYVKNATLYENMQELLVACDMIISDYSGCAFDYLMLKRPGFLYAEDYEEIKKVKDYYFTLEELPFDLAFDNEELEHYILNFDQKEYERKCEEYLKKIGYFDDGHAAEAAVDVILEKAGLPTYETEKSIH